jgi:hypothetical protein
VGGIAYPLLGVPVLNFISHPIEFLVTDLLCVKVCSAPRSEMVRKLLLGLKRASDKFSECLSIKQTNQSDIG